MFEKYINEITSNLFYAQYQARLYRQICKLTHKYQCEINRSPGFWSIILKSLQQSSLLSLARVYDQRKDTISLKIFLDFISENLDLLEKTELSQEEIEEQINQDLSSVSSKDNAGVNKLVQLRSNIIAHRNQGQILGTKKSIKKLTWDEFYLLVKTGFEIRNRYSQLYDKSTYLSDAFINKDDYQSVFTSLKITDLTLSFINTEFSRLNSEEFIKTTQNFIENVKKEIY